MSGAYFLDLAIAYYFCFLFKEKNGELYIYIGKELKRVLAYKILENKIVVMYSINKKLFRRRSFYLANRALITMRNLFINKYKILELIINDEKLNKIIQKLNSDDEIKDLAKQEISKHSSTRRLSRIFKKTEPLIDLKNTHPRTIERLNVVVDILWKKNAEADDTLFQLAFKEVMADDICRGREEMGLFKKILSVEKNL